MSIRHTDDGAGNSEKDWEIFDVLCRNMDKVCRGCSDGWLLASSLKKFSERLQKVSEIKFSLISGCV